MTTSGHALRGHGAKSKDAPSGGHLFVKHLKRVLRSHLYPWAEGNFKLGGTVSVHLHRVGGRTVAKLRSCDPHVVERIAPDVLIVEIGTNGLVDTSPEVVGSEILFVYYWSIIRFVSFVLAMSFHVVIPTTMRYLLRGALRFSGIISTLCFFYHPKCFL